LAERNTKKLIVNELFVNFDSRVKLNNNKKFQKIYVIAGSIIGALIGTNSDGFEANHGFEGAAYLIGSAIPLAFVGWLIGLVVEKLFKNGEK
jgi:hypothetical protein